MENSKFRVLYVTGTNRSGSTLLGILMNAHPHVVSIGEMGPAAQYSSDRYTCSCGQRMSDCPFFRDVAQYMASNGVFFDPADMRLRLSSDHGKAVNRLLVKSLGSSAMDAVRERVTDTILRNPRSLPALRERTERFIEGALVSANARVFVDTTKIPARIPFLQGCARIDLSVVHLVRDPRAQAFSSLKQHSDRSPARHASSWLRHEKSIERRLTSVPSAQRMILRYEDLCMDPGQRLSELWALAGVHEYADWDRYSEMPHHIIGNRMRKIAGAHAQISLDEAWRREMSCSDQEEVMRVAGAWAKRFGYNSDRDRFD